MNDLNAIQLNPQLAADLYGSVLVTGLPAEEKNEAPSPTAIRQLGNNGKGILIVVANETETFLREAEVQFLTNILPACKLGLPDVALVNNSHGSFAGYKDASANVRSNTILLFAIDPLSFGLPLNFPHFQIQLFDKITYLYAPSLREIEADKTLKGKLWTALKTIFSL